MNMSEEVKVVKYTLSATAVNTIYVDKDTDLIVLNRRSSLDTGRVYVQISEDRREKVKILITEDIAVSTLEIIIVGTNAPNAVVELTRFDSNPNRVTIITHDIAELIIRGVCRHTLIIGEFRRVVFEKGGYLCSEARSSAEVVGKVSELIVRDPSLMTIRGRYVEELMVVPGCNCSVKGSVYGNLSTRSVEPSFPSSLGVSWRPYNVKFSVGSYRISACITKDTECLLLGTALGFLSGERAKGITLSPPGPVSGLSELVHIPGLGTVVEVDPEALLNFGVSSRCGPERELEVVAPSFFLLKELPEESTHDAHGEPLIPLWLLQLLLVNSLTELNHMRAAEYFKSVPASELVDPLVNNLILIKRKE